MKAAPGWPPLLIECTQEPQNIKDDNEISGNVSGEVSGASVGATATHIHEKTVEKRRSFSAHVHVTTRPSEGHSSTSPPNEVKWIFAGNISQDNAIPPDLTLVTLLKRPKAGEFVCRVEVEVKIDRLHSTAEFFNKIQRWVRKAPWYHIDPAVPKLAGRSLEVDNMHKYENDEVIRPLWHIRMPEVYKEFKAKEQNA